MVPTNFKLTKSFYFSDDIKVNTWFKEEKLDATESSIKTENPIKIEEINSSPGSFFVIHSLL